MEHWWNDTGEKQQTLGENFVIVPLCSPQIFNHLAWD
jgi:hypothetical protein